MIRIPANSHFDRYRLAYSIHNRGYHLKNFVRLKQPAGTCITLRYFRYGAAHINIDNICVGVLIDDFGGLDKRRTVPAKNLQA
ncbi:hypothetical protein D3C85_1479820 [compost metagenome]